MTIKTLIPFLSSKALLEIVRSTIFHFSFCECFWSRFIKIVVEMSFIHKVAGFTLKVWSNRRQDEFEHWTFLFSVDSPQPANILVYRLFFLVSHYNLSHFFCFDCMHSCHQNSPHFLYEHTFRDEVRSSNIRKELRNSFTLKGGILGGVNIRFEPPPSPKSLCGGISGTSNWEENLWQTRYMLEGWHVPTSCLGTPWFPRKRWRTWWGRRPYGPTLLNLLPLRPKPGWAAENGWLWCIL